MNANRILNVPIRFMTCFLLVILLWCLQGCGPGFRVSKVSLGPPDDISTYGLTTASYTYKVTMLLQFNRAIKQSTLNAPGTAWIDLKGTHDGRTVKKIDGTFYFSGPADVAAEAFFISQKTLSELINPGPGENIVYTITLLGTSAGAGMITDANGEALDGDADGTPGGNYVETIEVVG